MSVFVISTFVLLLYCNHVYCQTDCECVPFYLCENGTIIDNGKGIIDVRMNIDDCKGYLEVCCKRKDMIPQVRAPLPKKKSECGYRNRDGVGYRIIGDYDNESQFAEFSWMTAILEKSPSDVKYRYRCGGSLIHPRVVLTAAHCIKKSNSFKIRAGEWDSKTTNEIFKHEDRKVVEVVIHRDFKKSNLANDVALLFLESPLDLVSHINVVCLPPPKSVILSDECFVTGWGKDKFEKNGVYQNILKKIELPMISHTKCEKQFRKTRLGRSFKLDRSFVCAGGQEGRDACSGDGGGPLVCPIEGEEDRYQQVGIIAWGIGCGTKDIPGAYVDVAYFRSWIDEQMKSKNFNTTFYQIQ